jgi:hypothetical protein
MQIKDKLLEILRYEWDGNDNARSAGAMVDKWVRDIDEIYKESFKGQSFRKGYMQGVKETQDVEKIRKDAVEGLLE